MSERAGIFDTDLDLDVSGFAPKPSRPTAATPPEMVRAVSEASSFRSREPALATELAQKKDHPARREPRRYRTGRNVQLNVKVRAETLLSFYELADREGWVLGETLEKAISALRKELSTTPIQEPPKHEKEG